VLILYKQTLYSRTISEVPSAVTLLQKLFKRNFYCGRVTLLVFAMDFASGVHTHAPLHLISFPVRTEASTEAGLQAWDMLAGQMHGR
jgi:hypothetical protein